MRFFKKKKQTMEKKQDYSAWCELMTILSKSELEELVIIESEWKKCGNKETGRFNMSQYLSVIQQRRLA